MIDSPDYQARYGRWDVIDLPEDMQVNAIHAALSRRTSPALGTSSVPRTPPGRPSS
jgi:hypothetical protein